MKITNEREFEDVGGKEITVELPLNERLVILFLGERGETIDAEITVRHENFPHSAAEVVVEHGSVVFYT